MNTHTSAPVPQWKLWATLAIVSLGAMMVALDGTIVLVAQPVLQSDLRASLEQVQWVTTGYVLAVGTFLITAGHLGDVVGHKRVFLVGVSGFAATSGAIGLADEVEWVIALRVLQGVFGAVLQPATLGILRTTFPKDGLDMPIAIRSTALGASLAAGPILGGLLVEHVSWEAVFFINVPLGLLVLVLAVFVLGDERGTAADARFDVPGAALLSLALLGLFWSAATVAASGWSRPEAPPLVLATALLLVALVSWERRVDAPLFPKGLFRVPALTITLVVVVGLAFTMIGTLFLGAYYLQNFRGLDPIDSGLQVLPLTATMVVAAPVVGAAMRRLGAGRLLAAGMATTSGGVLLMTRLDAETGPGLTGGCLLLMGLGLSPALVSSTKLVMFNTPRAHAGMAGGLHQTAMQIGSGLGVAAMGGLLIGTARPLVQTALTSDGAVAGPATVQEHAERVAVGVLQPLASTPPAARQAWEATAQDAFLVSFHSSLLAAVAVAAAAAVLALALQWSRRSSPSGAGKAVLTATGVSTAPGAQELVSRRGSPGATAA